jgi:hypothetical protein
MSKIPFEYFVDELEAGWAVNVNGQYAGPYASREDAYRTAVAAAQKAGDSDKRGAIVLMRDEDRRFRVVWKYGVGALG